MENWINVNNASEDIVLSSRIRLARNLKGIPFPNKLTVDSAKDVVEKVENAIFTIPNLKDNLKSNHLWENDNETNKMYLERHLISRGLIKHAKGSAFLIDEDETISIMINEEDHLRLQTITSGLNFKEVFKSINELDDLLEENLEYAFHEKLGYITACPTNLGTGLRASAMVHLPALTANKDIVKVLNGITQLGMTIRGLYGEGSKAYGNLYQISNQITLGRTEEQIITSLEGIVKQIIEQEKLARERMKTKYKYEVEDKIFRSLGILKSARILTAREVLNLLSNVRLGVEEGIISNVDKSILNNLLINTQSASIKKSSQKELTDMEEKIERAKIVKEGLKGIEL
ncbi:ATP:guanido phosphotransferase [Clostridium novyi A str. 4570]|uniref:Protein-arginine kinase n=1 Tax=Clostridium novyi A str. 4570 TaxID=1444290 RepID=A0AA88ZQR5_CLONO|nr:protein arginine kinase [Clostridium novyi]KGN02726.1 ATP:guanido phosphotransferase [Clostridium novyi A str. 4570]